MVGSKSVRVEFEAQVKSGPASVTSPVSEKLAALRANSAKTRCFWGAFVK